ncbi:hypothetical protein BNJ_00182 [Kaumoebavirus]|nr:hypothetical protein BNJ_00182 [Kaumoebavirus]ARA72013.1 hypothetical protein BNJ_00182 [Kaumoebavirus]
MENVGKCGRKEKDVRQEGTNGAKNSQNIANVERLLIRKCTLIGGG